MPQIPPFLQCHRHSRGSCGGENGQIEAGDEPETRGDPEEALHTGGTTHKVRHSASKASRVGFKKSHQNVFSASIQLVQQCMSIWDQGRQKHCRESIVEALHIQRLGSSQKRFRTSRLHLLSLQTPYSKHWSSGHRVCWTCSTTPRVNQRWGRVICHVSSLECSGSSDRVLNVVPPPTRHTGHLQI